MIVPDINLLVYAYNDKAPEHEKARLWWENCLNGSTPVGLSWVAANGFLRLVTHPRVFARPMPVRIAIAHVRQWIARPPVRIVQPGRHFSNIFLDYLEKLGAGGNLTSDAHLAALAVEYQAELHSNDGDFSRFPGLRWINPLRRS